MKDGEGAADRKLWKERTEEWLDNTYLTLTLVQQGIRRKSTYQSDGTVLSLLSDI